MKAMTEERQLNGQIRRLSGSGSVHGCFCQSRSKTCSKIHAYDFCLPMNQYSLFPKNHG